MDYDSFLLTIAIAFVVLATLAGLGYLAKRSGREELEYWVDKLMDAAEEQFSEGAIKHSYVMQGMLQRFPKLDPALLHTLIKAGMRRMRPTVPQVLEMYAVDGERGDFDDGEPGDASE